MHTDLTSASIADGLGFPTATAFTRFFRNRTGEAPTEFGGRMRPS
jgi:AraC-like DNA-binding protein